MVEQESKLIEKCKKGDVLAFEQLIEAYQKKAYNIALRFMGNEEDAKDMAQDALIKVYRYIDSFKEQSSFSTWMYRIVVNTCLDEIRKRKKIISISIDGNDKEEQYKLDSLLPANNETPETIFLNNQRKEEIQKAIYSLNDDYRNVIILRDMNGFSYEEISILLNCAEGTVKSRINRGRNQLKEKLTKVLELNKSKSV